jgi:hypothetical protein
MADDNCGNYLAVGLTSEKIDGYKKERLAKGDRPASINRPLQLIRQAYGLAVKRGHLSRVPSIEFLSEKGNARKGFCEETEFRKIREFLPDYLQDFCLFAYCTGDAVRRSALAQVGIREGRRDRTTSRRRKGRR